MAPVKLSNFSSADLLRLGHLLDRKRKLQARLAEVVAAIDAFGSRPARKRRRMSPATRKKMAAAAKARWAKKK